VNIGNIDVGLTLMVAVNLLAIGDNLTALFGIAGDVGDGNRPPARRGNNEPTPRRAAQFSNEVLLMLLRPDYSRIFFVFCLDSVDPFGHRFPAPLI